MKRLGKGLFEEIISKDNLEIAHANASRGKSHYKEVIMVEKNKATLLRKLRRSLLQGNFQTSDYKVQERVEGGKLRTIYVLPYYPDRILQHAILQKVEEFMINSLIRDTFQSLKGRGTSDARRRVQRFIKDKKPTHYLQIDIKKYYPSVSNDLLKEVIEGYIKCKQSNNLIFNIIDSCKGIPIGNYTSQIFGNIYLSKLDWFIKQELKVKGYYRYCDDLIFFGNSSSEMHKIKKQVEEELTKIQLTIKPCWVVSKLTKGLDFIGYQFYPEGIKLRKSIYKSSKKSLLNNKTKSIPAYFGWVLPLKDSTIKRRYCNAIRNQKK